MKYIERRKKNKNKQEKRRRVRKENCMRLENVNSKK